MSISTQREMQRGHSQAPCSSAQCLEQRQCAQLSTAVPSARQAALLCCAVAESWHRLPWGCGVSSLELPMGLGPALGGSAGAEGPWGASSLAVILQYDHSHLLLWSTSVNKWVPVVRKDRRLMETVQAWDVACSLLETHKDSSHQSWAVQALC